MATKKSGGNRRPNAGGGAGSKNVRDVNIRQGKPNREVRPGFAAQLGYAYGNHSTENRKTAPYRGEGFGGNPALNPAPLGNAVAASTKIGVGGSRTVHPCGSQGYLLPAKPPARGRPILQEYGPDYKGGGRG